MTHVQVMVPFSVVPLKRTVSCTTSREFLLAVTMFQVSAACTIPEDWFSQQPRTSVLYYTKTK